MASLSVANCNQKSSIPVQGIVRVCYSSSTASSSPGSGGVPFGGFVQTVPFVQGGESSGAISISLFDGSQNDDTAYFVGRPNSTIMLVLFPSGVFQTFTFYSSQFNGGFCNGNEVIGGIWAAFGGPITGVAAPSDPPPASQIYQFSPNQAYTFYMCNTVAEANAIIHQNQTSSSQNKNTPTTSNHTGVVLLVVFGFIIFFAIGIGFIIITETNKKK